MLSDPDGTGSWSRTVRKGRPEVGVRSRHAEAALAGCMSEVAQGSQGRRRERRGDGA